MHTFASPDTFVEASTAHPTLGRLGANLGFLEALVRHGPFERILLYAACRSEAVRTAEVLARRLNGPDPRVGIRLQIQMTRDLQAGEWDACHLGGWGRYLAPLVHLRARLSPRFFPVTAFLHSLDRPDMVDRLRPLAKAPLTAGDAIVCSSAAGSVAMGQLLDAAGAFRLRREVVPLGIPDEAFEVPDRALAREMLRLNGGRWLLWTGRFSKASKADLDPLLGVLAHLRQGREDLGLAAVGGGSAADLAFFRETARDFGVDRFIRWLPDLDEPTKRLWMAAADVFVFPVDSLQETFGLAVVEAMAAGLPVVASDWSGVRELVVEGTTGHLVPVWQERNALAEELAGILEPDLLGLLRGQVTVVDTKILHDRLAHLLDHPSRAREMGDAGRARALNCFGWKSVMRRLSALWQELSCSGPPDWKPDPAHLDPSLPDPFRVFTTWPTSVLSPSRSVRLSWLGAEVLGGRLPCPALAADVDLGARIDALEKLLRSALNGTDPAHHAPLLVAWALKQGLLQSEPQGDRRIVG